MLWCCFKRDQELRRQLQQFVQWCDRVGIRPATVTKEESKKYRRFLVEENCKPATIALKLLVVRRFYDAVERSLGQ